MVKLFKLFISSILFVSFKGISAPVLPSNLSTSEQATFLQSFGTQTTPKLLTNPYPLGGYDGFDIGLSVSSINLSAFDTSTLESNRITYPSFSISKGLFNDIDISFSFVPPLRQSTISNYSVLAKWSFNEGMFLPVVWSVSAHTSSTNAGDQFSSKSTGLELSGGYSFNELSVYGGVGFVTTNGRFLRQKNGVNFTASGQDEVAAANTEHLFIGAFYQLKGYYIAFQLDQYKDLISTSKIGLRF